MRDKLDADKSGSQVDPDGAKVNVSLSSSVNVQRRIDVFGLSACAFWRAVAVGK
jgi:hypothetical protein